MASVRSESSIDALCAQLDDLLRAIAAEVDLQQKRAAALRVPNEPADGETEVGGATELLGAVTNLKRQLRSVRDILKRQQILLKSLHDESRSDALSGLLNRRAFDEELARCAQDAGRTGRPWGLMMVDIDCFKGVNDSFGHAAGDKVLRGVADLLTSALRETDIVARYGGEEFVAILPEANLLQACRAAERARFAIGTSTIPFEEHRLGATVSVGVAPVEGDAMDALRQADDALYAAKRAGRNRVFVFKDGYAQPLEQASTDGPGAGRRQWLRFVVNDVSMRMRTSDGLWHEARAHDESLTGIGLLVEDSLQVTGGDVVEIEYLGEIRKAVVKNSRPCDGPAGGVRLGLEWKNA